MNRKALQRKLTPWIAVGFLALVAWMIYLIIAEFFELLSTIDTRIALGIVTAAGTIIVSTITVVLGRYIERRKEIEAHFRERKIKIYDEFLKEFFLLFENTTEEESHSENNKSADSENLVNFLREWQRKIILWGGQDVLNSYIKWINYLKNHEPDAKTMFLTEDFFRAVRKDIGHQNWKLTQGTFVHLILREPDLFLAAAKANPEIKLAQLAELEAAHAAKNERR